jgi:hypothetical protein
MRNSALSLLAALFLCLAATPAAADPPGAALRFYAAGNFLAAADLAEARRSPDSLAFAARALMAECVVSPNGARTDALADRAEAAARTALALDPQSVEARLQYAIALGVRGRRATLSEAWRHGYAPRGRDLIEEAIDLSPNNAWAHALMGGWNLEVLRRGGRAGAIAYGARERAGIAAFERARRLAPNDPMITLHYAIALIDLDAEHYAGRASQLLAIAAAAAPRDAFEAHALARAARLASALETDGPRAAAALSQTLFQ